jgi:polysaccharide pyruvyl transferase WcaK-like protein
MNLLAPFGFYGWGNIGDEATLQGFGRLVARSPQRFRVWLGSRNPRHTARVEPSFRYFHAERRDWRRWWAKRRTSAAVVAGGTPIMDCHGDYPFCELVPLIEEAHKRGRQIIFVGSGTERLQRDESRRIMANRIAPIVRYWTVRNELDRARLLEYGVPDERVCVAADMAWLLDPVSLDWGREQIRSWGIKTSGPLIGVNLVNQKPVPSLYPHLFDTVAEFLDNLIKTHGATILFLANDVKDIPGFDRSTALRTIAAMKYRDRTYLAPNEYLPPQKMMSLIANCNAIVSMRYHFCLFSALQGVPFLALQRSDKVSDLCWDLNWPFGTKLDDLEVGDLIPMYEALVMQGSAAVNHLRLRSTALRERACRNWAALEALHVRTELVNA